MPAKLIYSVPNLLVWTEIRTTFLAYSISHLPWEGWPLTSPPRWFALPGRQPKQTIRTKDCLAVFLVTTRARSLKLGRHTFDEARFNRWTVLFGLDHADRQVTGFVDKHACQSIYTCIRRCRVKVSKRRPSPVRAQSGREPELGYGPLIIFSNFAS